jgi:hypothetical protein
MVERKGLGACTRRASWLLLSLRMTLIRAAHSPHPSSCVRTDASGGRRDLRTGYDSGIAWKARECLQRYKHARSASIQG